MSRAQSQLFLPERTLLVQLNWVIKALKNDTSKRYIQLSCHTDHQKKVNLPLKKILFLKHVFQNFTPSSSEKVQA